MAAPDRTGTVEPTAKRVRALLHGRVVVDSRRAQLVWEHAAYPQYLLPRADVDLRLEPSAAPPRLGRRVSQRLGEPVTYDVVTPGGERLEGAAWTWPEVDGTDAHVRLAWDAVDSWLEEDEPVIVHPRSPYVRVDCLRSSRHVRIELDGVTLAESPRPTVLFETGLRPRWYLPLTDVRTDLLVASDRTTYCPYKGQASYWSVRMPDGRLHEDLVWCYRAPLPECSPIIGLACFYDERVQLVLDGDVQGAQ